ncbi:MAG: DUF488 domain-containing protein [Candidatus Hydrogenedentes bacterium]|nr:DUF488 domain-containing protein [Candidatus Hydrogenedentota bacterium]MBI3118598.1 DUF488 domain-containing protein [Candidatus Hydrogenedentota bacterium]
MLELFTIGHSNHAMEQFLGLLGQHGVSAVADVRSSPYSAYSPHFSKEPLQNALRQAGFEYVFLGQELGARRGEASCYVNGQARYDRIKDLPAFSAGLERLREGMDNFRVALMCSEADPLTCHRTILVCREIKQRMPSIQITHILPDGAEEPHAAAEERLVRLHKLEPELFGELSTVEGLLERAYDLQAERIAYRKEETAE